MIERKGKLDDRSDSDRNLSEKIPLEKGEGEGGKKDGNDKNEKELFGTRNDDDTDKHKYFSIVGSSRSVSSSSHPRSSNPWNPHSRV